MDDSLLPPPAEVALTQQVTLRSVASKSIPAIVNNVAAPLAVATQLSLLAHAGNSPALATENGAAWTAVGAVITFVVGVLNFLIVVTMARVGSALGAKQWRVLGFTVRTTLLAALAAGCIVSCALWLLRAEVLASLSLQPRNATEPLALSYPNAADSANTTAREVAAAYLPVALLRLPPLLLLKAASSVLVGYQRVRAASLLNAGLAVFDVAAFYIVLHVLERGLVEAGLVVAASCAAAAALALLLVLCRPPEPTVRVCCAGAGGGGGNGGGNGGDGAGAGSDAPATLLELARASLNVLVRSVLLAGSVLSMTFATAPLGAAALVAHAVVLQLWMVTSYVVDGFADVGTMVGSRLLGAGAAQHMRKLTALLASLGLATGVLAAAALGAARAPLVWTFTRDEATAALLCTLWPLLCALQPINALVFVYDGILYATQSFAYVRNCLAVAVLGIYAPALAAARALAPRSLLAIWAAKAGLNAARAAFALWRIHVQLWPRWVAR